RSSPDTHDIPLIINSSLPITFDAFDAFDGKVARPDAILSKEASHDEARAQIQAALMRSGLSHRL
ncbi:hypothetical protein ACXYUI_27140, partial [Klebsiella pneumoniae]